MKTVLIIGFSLNSQYNRKGYENILTNYDKVYYINPFKYFWKNFFFISPGKWKYFFLFSFLKIVKKLIPFYQIDIDEISDNEKWTNFELLKKNFAFSRAQLLDPLLKNTFKSLKKSFFLTKKLYSQINQDHFVLPINDIDSTGYLLDSLQRFVPNFKIFKMKSPLVFLSTFVYIYNIILYLEWFEKFTNRNKIDTAIVNHQFYMESGFISDYLNTKFNTNIIHFSQKNNYPVFVEPRVKWFKNILDKKLSESISNNKDLVNEKKNLHHQDNALFDIEDCSKKLFDKNTIVFVMHSFADANSMHVQNGVIFSSHFQWIRSTLSIAKKNKNIKYIFRAHPASYDYYGYRSDLQVIDYFFGNLNEENIKFESPKNYSYMIKKNKVPIFITAKSNFSQELAIAGMKCLTLDDTSAPNDCCKKIISKTEYLKWISGKGEVEELRLSEKQRYAARLNKQIYAELNNLL